MTPELENLHNIIAHGGDVKLICIYKETGNTLASTGDDFIINLWNVGSNKPKNTIGPFKSKITAMAFGEREDILLCGNYDGTVMLINLIDSRILNQWIVHKSQVTSVCFHPKNQSIILTAGKDGKILQLSTNMRRPQQIISAHKGTIKQISITQDGKYIASCGADKKAKVFEMTTYKEVAKFDLPDAGASVAFHQTRPLIAVGCKDRSIQFFDYKAQKQLPCNTPLDSAIVEKIIFEGEFGVVFSVSKDYLKVVGWEPPKLHDHVTLGFDCINDISINGNKITLVSSSGDRMLIDRVRKDEFEPFMYNPVAVVRLGQGEIEIAPDITTMPKSARLLDMDIVRSASAQLSSRSLKSSSSKRSTATTKTRAKLSTTSKTIKAKPGGSKAYYLYKKEKDTFLEEMESKYKRLQSISEMIDSDGFEAVLEKTAESGENDADLLSIIVQSPLCVTEFNAHMILKIAGRLFGTNDALAVEAVECILESFGSIFVDFRIDESEDMDEREIAVDAALSELRMMKLHLKRIKNGYTPSSEVAASIFEEYANIFI